MHNIKQRGISSQTGNIRVQNTDWNDKTKKRCTDALFLTFILSKKNREHFTLGRLLLRWRCSLCKLLHITERESKKESVKRTCNKQHCLDTYALALTSSSPIHSTSQWYKLFRWTNEHNFVMVCVREDYSLVISIIFVAKFGICSCQNKMSKI